MKKLIFCIIIGMLLINLINAEVQTLPTVQLNKCADLKQTCGNCSYVTISSLVYPNYTNALRNVNMTKDGTHYNYTFCYNTIDGEYVVNLFGDVDGVDTPAAYNYFVTASGKERTTGGAIFYFTTLLLLIVLLILSIWGFTRLEKPYLKLAVFYGAYLLLVAISYISWIATLNFLTVTGFIAEFFRWTFMILIILFIPLLFGSWILYFYLLFKLKAIQNMLKRGMPEDEAYARTVSGGLRKYRRKKKW